MVALAGRNNSAWLRICGLDRIRITIRIKGMVAYISAERLKLLRHSEVFFYSDSIQVIGETGDTESPIVHVDRQPQVGGDFTHTRPRYTCGGKNY